MNKYKLNSTEIPLWNSIEQKAKDGYREFVSDPRYKENMCGPWTRNSNIDERALLSKIHEEYYGSDWHVVMPISQAQVDYTMYENIKDKVSHE